MFDQLKKVFGGGTSRNALTLADWAQEEGLQAQGRLQDAQFGIDGEAGGKPWRLERGTPSRDFIRGTELRGRADLGLDDGVAVMVINRPLKEALESRAYADATDSLQTTVDTAMNEEMRWLSMFDEQRFSGAPDAFWSRYAVVADSKEPAQRWIDAPLAEALAARADSLQRAQTPFVLMLLRGKVYLRAEFTPPTIDTLDSAVAVWRAACNASLRFAP